MKKFLSTAKSGFVDPVSLITLGFLVVGLVVSTAIVKNPDISLDIRNWAYELEDEELKFIKKVQAPKQPAKTTESTPAQPSYQPPDSRQEQQVYTAPTQTTTTTAPTITQPTEESRFVARQQVETQYFQAHPEQKPSPSPTTTPITVTKSDYQKCLDKGNTPTECSPVAQNIGKTITTPADQAKAAPPAPAPKSPIDYPDEGRYTQQLILPIPTPTPTPTPTPAPSDFMLGLYYGINPSVSSGQTPLDQQSLGFLTQNGINSLIISASPWLNENNILEIQESAEQANLNTFWGADMLTNYYSPGINQANIQVNSGLITQLNQSPNLAGFYALDEPTADKVNNPLYPNAQNNIYTQISELAPDKPVITVFYPALEFADYQQLAADFIAGSNTQIVGTDPYYWSTQPEEQVFNDISYTNNLITSGQLGPSVQQQVAVLSAHSDVAGRTYESFQYQALSAVTAGASGIFWWDWGTGCNQQNCGGGTPDQSGYSTYFQNISSTANLLQTAMPGLTGQTVATTANSAASYRVNQATNNQLYVFAISNSGDLSSSIASSQIPNQYPQAPSDDYFLRQQYLGNQPTSLNNLPPNTVFQVVGENRTVTTDAHGNLRDAFGIMNSHIYQQILP